MGTNFQILSESGPFNSKILVKYSYQVGVFWNGQEQKKSCWCLLLVSRWAANTIAISFKWTKINRVDIETCEQVSRGMEFLEQHKIVHGDLAARWLREQPNCKNIFHRFSGTSCSLKKAQLQKCPTSASPTRCTPPLRSWTTPRPVFQFGGWRPRFWWIGRWVTYDMLVLCTWQDIYILSFPGEQQKWHLVLWCSSLGSVQSRRCSLSWDRSNWPPVHSSKVAKLVTNGLEYFFLQDLNDGLRHLGNPLYKVELLDWNIALTTQKYSTEQYCTRWKRCKRTSTKSGSPPWKWLRKKGDLSADNKRNYLHLTLCI